MILRQTFITLMLTLFVSPLMFGQVQAEPESPHHDHEGHHKTENERGPHRGKIFHDGDFAIELTIFEQGVPPQFRVYTYDDDKEVNPADVSLSIELHRLDGEVNHFSFTPQDDVLVGEGVVTEPHSFDVKMKATYQGKTHTWSFSSYEGRTEISDKSAKEAGVKTEKASSNTIAQYARLTGRITLNRNTTSQVRARFPGIVKTVNASWGQQVKKGHVLATIESNESLKTYKVVAPTNGVVLARNTNIGDVAKDEPLFTIADLSQVWAEFHVFPTDLNKVQQGQMTHVRVFGGNGAQHEKSNEAPIKMLLPTADPLSQTVLAIVPLSNKEGQWRPGMTIQGDVLVNEKKVPLAVKVSALQRFRDFTVVFAKVGETYEVRMLELGDNDGKFVEVLGGLKPNTEYVTENSFLIKADIEKSGASHGH